MISMPSKAHLAFILRTDIKVKVATPVILSSCEYQAPACNCDFTSAENGYDLIRYPSIF